MIFFILKGPSSLECLMLWWAGKRICSAEKVTGKVICWGPCRKSTADRGRHVLGCPANPHGQPCSQTCYLVLCVKYPLCWKEGSLLLGSSPVPKQNAGSSGKRKPTTLGGCALRYSAIVTENLLFHPELSLCARAASAASVVTWQTAAARSQPAKKEQNLEPCHNLTWEIASSHCVWKPSSSDLFSVTDWVNVLLYFVLQRRTCFLSKLLLS